MFEIWKLRRGLSPAHATLRCPAFQTVRSSAVYNPVCVILVYISLKELRQRIHLIDQIFHTQNLLIIHRNKQKNEYYNSRINLMVSF